MRGHWISNTRKLNRHYQSGNGEKVTPWDDFILPIDHAGLYWGVDHSDAVNFSLPLWAQHANKLELDIAIEENSVGSSILYLCYLYITVILYDIDGNQETFYVRYWCPWDSYAPTPSSYTLLDYSSFLNCYGNSNNGEPFVLDSVTGLYRLRSTIPTIDIQALDPNNTGVYRISYQALFRSTTTPQTAIFTRKARLKKI